MGACFPSKVSANHGTAVCDGGACTHKDGGCLVQQPTDEEVTPYSEIYQETGSTANSAIIWPAVHVLPRDRGGHDNETAIPIKEDNAIGVAIKEPVSGYHTLPEIPKPEDLPKAKSTKGTSFNGRPYASFVPKATQNGLSHGPSQLQVTPNGKVPELETNQHFPLAHIGEEEEAFLRQQGTTLVHECRPFGGPDPGGGEINVHHEYDDELKGYITTESIWDIVEPKQAT